MDYFRFLKVFALGILLSASGWAEEPSPCESGFRNLIREARKARPSLDLLESDTEIPVELRPFVMRMGNSTPELEERLVSAAQRYFQNKGVPTERVGTPEHLVLAVVPLRSEDGRLLKGPELKGTHYLQRVANRLAQGEPPYQLVFDVTKVKNGAYVDSEKHWMALPWLSAEFPTLPPTGAHELTHYNFFKDVAAARETAAIANPRHVKFRIFSTDRPFKDLAGGRRYEDAANRFYNGPGGRALDEIDAIWAQLKVTFGRVQRRAEDLRRKSKALSTDDVRKELDLLRMGIEYCKTRYYWLQAFLVQDGAILEEARAGLASGKTKIKTVEKDWTNRRVSLGGKTSIYFYREELSARAGGKGASEEDLLQVELKRTLEMISKMKVQSESVFAELPAIEERLDELEKGLTQ